MEQPEAYDERRAALLVHALSPADQQRVIERLTPDRQQRLQTLLHELQALGIPKGRTWVPEHKPDDSSDPAARLERLANDVALASLVGQSTDTVATLLAVKPWPWTEHVLAHWPAAERSTLASAVSQRRDIPPSLAQHLMAQMWTASRQVRASAPVRLPLPASRLSWFARWLPSRVVS